LIKPVCRIAGLKEIVAIEKTIGGKKVREEKPKYLLISSHTARRSAVTNAYKAGVPIADIMVISGHSTERNLYKYLKITDLERLDKMMQHPYFKQ
jgi:hypothetical protein